MVNESMWEPCSVMLNFSKEWMLSLGAIDSYKRFFKYCTMCALNTVLLQKLCLWSQETMEALFSIWKKNMEALSMNLWHGKQWFVAFYMMANEIREARAHDFLFCVLWLVTCRTIMLSISCHQLIGPLLQTLSTGLQHPSSSHADRPSLTNSKHWFTTSFLQPCW